MNLLAIAFAMTVAMGPVQEAATPPMDWDEAIRAAAEKVVMEDLAAETGGTLVYVQDPTDPERGFFTMLYGDSYGAPELAFMAASAFSMYVDSDFRSLCADNEALECAGAFPNSVPTDAMLTAGVYAGVKGVQRLAKKYWDVDLDEGWKNLLIFGGLTAVRALVAADGMSLNNQIREIR